MWYLFLSIAIYFLSFAAILLAPSRRNALYGWIATLSAGLSLASIAYIWFTQNLPGEFIVYQISVSGIAASFGLIADSLSLLGTALVSFVAFFVFLYAQDYMREDESQKRFFAEICLFAGAMVGILLSPSLLQMFVFWEIVGLSSYLLIGFWFEKPEVAKAAQKVFTLIMGGDVLLLAGIILLGGEMGSWNFNVMNSWHTLSSSGFVAVLLILSGAFVKSAQVPFFFWLPWAMEGPTPVSALLHSATMVKAGVFLVLRIMPLLFLFNLQPVVLAVSFFTIFIAGLAALAERDIKRVLAYSTVSQLGFMFLAIGLDNPQAGIFHLTSDAFYKALLFLGAGVIIHLGGSRDIFSLKKFDLRKNSVILGLVAIGVLGISGFPPLGSFFSKDAILDAALEHGSTIFILAVCGAFLTNIYILRWFFLILRAAFGSEIPHEEPSHSKELFGRRTKTAMGILATGVLFFGFLGTRFFSSFFYTQPPELNLGIVALMIILFGIAVAITFFAYIRRFPIPEFFAGFLWGGPYFLTKEAFGFEAGAELMARLGLKVAFIFSIIDNRLIDGVLGRCIAVAHALAQALRTIDEVVIDGVLDKGISAFVKFCSGTRWLDWEVVDGFVRDIALFFQALANYCRPLVNGMLGRYLIAFSFGIICLTISLHFVL